MRRKFVLFLVWALVVASAGAVLIEPVGAESAPGMPTDVTATAVDDGVMVTWTAPVSNGGEPITLYTVTATPSAGNTTSMPPDPPASTSVTFTGLTPGTYTFTVTATNSVKSDRNGESLPSVASAAITIPAAAPGAPTDVKAGKPVDGDVTVTWKAPTSDGGSDITSYTVTAARGADDTTSTLPDPIDTSDMTDPTDRTVTFIGLDGGGSYTFTVTATNDIGTGDASDASAQAAITIPATAPDAPTAVMTTTAVDDDVTVVTVTWTAPTSDGGSDITSYTVIPAAAVGDRTSTAPDPIDTSTILTCPTCTSVTFTGFTPGGSYTFTVTATNDIGTGDASDASAQAAITIPATAPDAPTDVKVDKPAANGDVTVTWTAPRANGGDQITSYTVTATPSDDDTEMSMPDTIDTSTMACPICKSVTFTGLSPGGSYTFTVTATNSRGGTGDESEASAAITIPAAAPDAPTDVKAGEPAANGDVTVTWTAPRANGKPITSYTVTPSDGGATMSPTDRTVTFTDLYAGTYTFTVTATNGIGTGDASVASEAVTIIETTKSYVPVPVDVDKDEVTQIPIILDDKAGEADKYPSMIILPTSLVGVVSGVSVKLHDVQHASTRDLDILLVAPDGTNSILMTDVGGTSAIDDVDLMFTAGAQQLSSEVGEIVSGTYAPTKGTAAADDCKGFCGPDVSETSDEASLAVFNGLKPGGTWRLYVYDDEGTESGQIDSWTLYLTIRDDVPGAPTDVTTTAVDGDVTVTWTAPTSDGGSDITSYTVTAARGADDTTSTLPDPIDTSDMTDPTDRTVTFIGLDGGGSYTFTVTATNDVGTGDASAASAAITIPATAPDAPTAVMATTAVDDDVTVTWTAPRANGSDITSYTVTASPGGAMMSTSDTSVTFTDLDAGMYTFTVTATNDIGTGDASAASAAVSTTRGQGYWLVDESGMVYPFGPSIEDYGDLTDATAAVTDIEVTPSGQGYWLVTADGVVSDFGDAVDYGGWTPDADERVTGISGTPDGGGYWLFSDKGRVRAFGNAVSFGDLQGITLDGPVIDAIATISGNGYWMLGADGGVFAFGDAVYYGSIPEVLPGVTLDGPTVGLVPTPSGQGYWMVAADGGVFAFGDADFVGSLPGIGTTPTMPITGMVAFFDGYLMLGADGGVFNFSSAPFYGSLGADSPLTPVIGIAAIG